MSAEMRPVTSIPTTDDTVFAGSSSHPRIPPERELSALRMLLGRRQPLSKECLASKIGLAQAEVEALAEQMLAAGLVQEAGTDTLSCGAPDIVLTRLLDSQQSQLTEQLELQLMLQVAVEQFNDVHRCVPANPHVAHGRALEGEQEIREAFDEAVCRARSEVLMLHPWMPATPDGLLRSRQRKQHLIEKSVTVQAVYPDTVMQVPHGRAHLRALQEIGVHNRTLSCVPVRILLVDGSTAYAATTATDDGSEAWALQLHGRTAARMVRAIFEYCWFQARQLQPHRHPRRTTGAGRSLTDREMALLRMLSEGRADTAIARSLGVSPRTFRRLTGEVMERLGAGSRFQAGVRAADLGLLNSTADIGDSGSG